MRSMLRFAQTSDRELSSSLTWRSVAWLAFDVLLRGRARRQVKVS